MTDRDGVAIKKIADYMRETLEFIDGMTKDDFTLDRKTIAAVAFNIGQIGELAGIISQKTQIKNAQIPWREIRGMRNRVIHDYERVDLSVIWNTITSDFPMVLMEIDKIAGR